MYSGCGVEADGGLLCWGVLASHEVRPIGLLSPGREEMPIATRVRSVVSNLPDRAFACALDDGGAVWCWGRAASGETNNPALPLFEGLPRRVALPRQALEIAAVEERACALVEGGGVVCWGHPYGGATGMRSISDEDGEPLSGMTQIHVGVGLDAQGAVWAWGDLRCAPEGTAAEARLMPARRLDRAPMLHVGSTGSMVCGVRARDRAVECWRTATRWHDLEQPCSMPSEPWSVQGLPPTSHLRCNTLGCTAVGTDGAVHTFGAAGRPSSHAFKVDVLYGLQVSDAMMGPYGGCAERADSGEVVCWGGLFADAPLPVGIGERIIAPRRTP